MSTAHARPGGIVHLGGGLFRGLTQNWWLLLLRGIAALILGILAFAMPALTLATLILVWGFYMTIDGVTALLAAIAGRGVEVRPRWWLATVGIAGIAAGLTALLVPAAAAGALVLFIGAWAVVIGALHIAGAIQLRKEIKGEWMLALSGVLAIAFGLALALNPAMGAIVLVWLIGWYAILAGCSYVALSLRLRHFKQS